MKQQTHRGRVDSMTTYTDKDISALATLAGISIPEGDLAEIALRLTVLVNAVNGITDSAIDSIDPAPLGDVEKRT
jgi:hypothetical protein